MPGLQDFAWQERPLPDHASATVAMLRKIIRKLETGTPPEDIGEDVQLIGRMMARRI